MPQIGEIRTSKEIGITDKRPYRKHIWVACPFCHKERWVGIIHGEPETTRCRKCANLMCMPKGQKNHFWRGGRNKNYHGYIEIKLIPEDPFYPMVHKGRYILEHRLIMAKHLGRLLRPWELVHHKNEIKDDNRIENLELIAKRKHITEHLRTYQAGYRQGYEDAQRHFKETGEIIPGTDVILNKKHVMIR